MISRLVLVGVGILPPTLALAEERTFAVTQDGKPAGEVVFTFATRDATATVASKSIPDPKVASPFSYSGTETWKAGRLVRLEISGSANGRRGGVTLLAGKDGYSLKAGVKDVTVRGEVWPNTFTTCPDADRPLVVDVITGDVLRAKVEKVGADRVTVGGKAIAATLYRLTAGGSKTDLWFDEQKRLVRRAWTRDGHALLMALTKFPSEPEPKK